MTENLDLDLLLATHDPAPAEELSAAETHRREWLLRTVLADTAPDGRAGRPRGGLLRRLGLGLAGGALLAGIAGAGALVLAPGTVQDAYHRLRYGTALQPMFTSAELASWTGAPAPASSQGAAWCERSLREAPGYGSPQTVLYADLRGQVASEIVTRAGRFFLCMSAERGGGFWDTIDPVPAALGSRQVLIDTGGGHGVGGGDGRDGFGYATGFAGDAVRSVTIHSDGHDTTALVRDRRWTAWWPMRFSDSVGAGTVTITATDGTSRTVPEAQLYRQ
ncbi:hypothetical protein [Streptacidiphilus melanogenes]|uniref:hypothetical protein n=1 Tax=Streptacidiphilus melanogenes TaxID=411235 RepID=UPI0005AB1D1F|nr:hypothetical protein [Streptacidiphilus melanogenes]